VEKVYVYTGHKNDRSLFYFQAEADHAEYLKRKSEESVEDDYLFIEAAAAAAEKNKQREAQLANKLPPVQKQDEKSEFPFWRCMFGFFAVGGIINVLSTKHKWIQTAFTNLAVGLVGIGGILAAAGFVSCIVCLLASSGEVALPDSFGRVSIAVLVVGILSAIHGVIIGEAVEAIRAAERQIALPATITTNFSGTAALFQDAQKGQVPLILAAVLTIYIVLGVLYESYIHPITILSGLPSAGLGALIALWAYGMDLSVIAIIGILLLVGIVKKNAIMMIDFAIERRNEGMDALPAIREAALIRFRPIFMTTMAAILGAVPIAIGAGAGAELRQPLGIAIVGGLCVSQVLTLFITPVVYYYLDKVDSYLSGRDGKVVVAELAPVLKPAE
jgi:hypothetical protein